MPHQFNGGYLLLEDGAVFPGEALYGPVSALGEAVFNTSHSGYQEILTDPSYLHQVMVFTAVHIGNVGVNAADMESPGVQAAGAVVRNLSPRPRNWRAEGDLVSFLEASGVPLLAGVDTRAVTLHLRQRGAMRCGIFAGDTPRDEALARVLASPDMAGADLASQAACDSAYTYDPSALDPLWHPLDDSGQGLRVAVLDCGVKRNILRQLASRGCEITVLPAATQAGTILAGGYHGVLASNGPGDPAAVPYAVETIQGLIGKLPFFGICLGHQLLALAAGLETYKLPFGHRGANHPVRREADGVVEITSQNHGFAVRPDGLGGEWRITHVNLNDGTVEGLEHAALPAFSVQYHPEASPGPHEAFTYFDRFIREMRHAQAR
ncbi:MAG: carbamoyl-phosphate synthase small subunit [Candidatus Zixiibacteriota bacterium]|nr:MAG: carbamoyl-phosphate synthase small subunit [candidate division Zixibacteria bacterium]